MSDVAIEVDHMWKKFRKGQIHDSLREWIPSLARRLVGAAPGGDALGEQEFWALKNVSFKMIKGESLGIIGPNGAGKSTMFKLLSRILKPDRGTYTVNGRVSALIEVGAGFHTELTGRENIYLNGAILGMTRREIRLREEQIIDFAEVEEFIETPVKRYSSGMKARLGFAVAAHMEPDILLVDEVLSVGDVRFQAKSLRHMHNLIRSNVTVIFISHMVDQVRALCPNTLVLDHGRAIYHGPTEKAIATYLDILSDTEAETAGDEDTDAELRHISFTDDEGRTVTACEAGQAVTIEAELFVRRTVEKPIIQVNFATLQGTFLGVTNSRRYGITGPFIPGRYHLRLRLDPMPLSDGDFQVRFVVGTTNPDRILWMIRQPHILSVRDRKGTGSPVRFAGEWSIMPQEAPAGNLQAS